VPGVVGEVPGRFAEDALDVVGDGPEPADADLLVHVDQHAYRDRPRRPEDFLRDPVPGVFEEITRTEPGQQVLLDRTLDLMLITALRAWLTRPGAHVPAWYLASSDPVVGAALRLLDADPAHPWTVASLAAKTGVSRAALARRFTTLVGQPPMTYLREQRLALAADLLRDPGTTLGAIAGRVGFAHAFALSTAFKKRHGISPSEYRSGTAG
jgi:AraC-like DNA-binding protein